MQSKIYTQIKTSFEKGVLFPSINKNGVIVRKHTIFEEIVYRNLDNVDTVALEVNGSTLTYGEFFLEVERYMSAFRSIGLHENDVVSLCLPVSVEFICAYYALTTLGVACNALNIVFLLSQGAKPYLEERNSKILVCYDKFYDMLLKSGAFENSDIEKIILTGDESYAHFNSDKAHIATPVHGIGHAEMLTLDSFLSCSFCDNTLPIAKYDENRISTLNYTSGTTGIPKCMAHSDLAPLFLVAAHDHIPRDEFRGDRTLLTIPLQHPTGLFYSMVFQMAQGKTLVLEPRYEKKLFAHDIKILRINHVVQAKPFYAQLIQDQADGNLRPGDFELLRNPYSGGEGIPLPVFKEINRALEYAGCKAPLALGYGRSEEGSLTINAYNMQYRQNTVGLPLPGIKAKLIHPETLEEIPLIPGARGEIVVATPVMPIGHCYLGTNNSAGSQDGSFVDDMGVRWARPRDIAEYVELQDGQCSFLVLGRSDDSVPRGGKIHYLFDLKEQISSIDGVQECEVLKTLVENDTLITVHCVIGSTSGRSEEVVSRDIFKIAPIVDGIKFYPHFAINATSGKCDRETMCKELDNFYVPNNGQILRQCLLDRVEK